MILQIMWFTFIAMAAASAVALLFIRNILHAALLLVVTLVSLAGIYLLLQAEFLAVTQILVYAGGVLVLIIFGIMLTPRLSIPYKESHQGNTGLALVVAGGLLAAIAYPLSFSSGWTASRNMDHHLEEVGTSLFTKYAAPFELAGILLLVSLVSAIVICAQVLARKRT